MGIAKDQLSLTKLAKKSTLDVHATYCDEATLFLKLNESWKSSGALSSTETEDLLKFVCVVHDSHNLHDIHDRTIFQWFSALSPYKEPRD